MGVTPCRRSENRECYHSRSGFCGTHKPAGGYAPPESPQAGGRPPRSAAAAPVGLLALIRLPISPIRLRDEGVPRGPGGPPSHCAESPALRKPGSVSQLTFEYRILLSKTMVI